MQDQHHKIFGAVYRKGQYWDLSCIRYIQLHLVTSSEVMAYSTTSMLTIRYVSFKATPKGTAAAVSQIEACARDIDAQMLSNKLKLNREKQKLLCLVHIIAPARPYMALSLRISRRIPSPSARNIGATLEK